MADLPKSIARTPTPPYYAVIFTSRRSGADTEGYGAMAAKLAELAVQQPGFLGMESVRDANGVGITVSYWTSREAIDQWGRHADHVSAQVAGRTGWYEAFGVRICRVESDRFFPAGEGS